jgi:hypothetical protein
MMTYGLFISFLLVLLFILFPHQLAKRTVDTTLASTVFFMHEHFTIRTSFMCGDAAITNATDVMYPELLFFLIGATGRFPGKLSVLGVSETVHR